MSSGSGSMVWLGVRRAPGRSQCSAVNLPNRDSPCRGDVLKERRVGGTSNVRRSTSNVEGRAVASTERGSPGWGTRPANPKSGAESLLANDGKAREGCYGVRWLDTALVRLLRSLWLHQSAVEPAHSKGPFDPRHAFPSFFDFQIGSENETPRSQREAGGGAERSNQRSAEGQRFFRSRLDGALNRGSSLRSRSGR